MDQMEQLAAYVPWMLANGNHEIDWPSGADRYAINGNVDSGALPGPSCHLQTLLQDRHLALELRRFLGHPLLIKQLRNIPQHILDLKYKGQIQRALAAKYIFFI